MQLTTIKTPQLSKVDNQRETYNLSGFGRPFGLGKDSQGYFYITDMDLHTVFRISPNLDKITWLNTYESHWLPEQPIRSGSLPKAQPAPPSILNGPHSIDFDQNNNFYVTTYYTPAIKVFRPSGEFSHDIGGKNSERVLQGPASSFFDDKCRLLVTEYAQNAILAYDAAGNYFGSLGCKKSNITTYEFEKYKDFQLSKLPGGFNRPHMIKSAHDGFLYCADTWNHRIQKFSATGKFELLFTHNQLQHPVSIGFMANDHLITTSWSNNCILIFSLEGELKCIYENLNLNKPYDAQFYCPWLVIADSHNGCILFTQLDSE